MRSAFALLLALVLTSCGVPTDREPRALDATEAPFQVFSSTAPPAPSGDGRVALYFVRDDRVVLQTRAVERSTDVDQLLDLLLEGPTPQQIEAGIRSALPTTLSVAEVEVGRKGVAVVTLGGESTQISTSPLGFAQVVATLTAPGRAQSVRFRLDGQDLPVPRGDTSLTEEPVDRSDYADLLAIASPTPAPPPVPEPPASPAPG
ncbi:hypothetical protein BH24ACT10_BH24ACT10_05500 [soil metagenome]